MRTCIYRDSQPIMFAAVVLSRIASSSADFASMVKGLLRGPDIELEEGGAP